MSLLEIRRSVGSFLTITRNRMAGRSFTPDPRSTIFIETSGRCNLACRFCAYPKQGPTGFMTQECFEDAVDQAVEMGFTTVWLTPMLGEIFADPACLDRFDYLESHTGIAGFAFYSNFILARKTAIRRLPEFRKLIELHISIYGYDSDSFQRVTRKPTAQFKKLLENLEVLDEILPEMALSAELHFSIRTLGGTTLDNMPDTEMTRRLASLERHGATLDIAAEFDNWGGTITSSDVREIGITLTDGRMIYRRGACSLMFSSVQIKSDGQVHACACRDVDGSLTLGDLNSDGLDSILSYSNPSYRNLIESHQKGDYGANCRTCSVYQSIYDHRSSARLPESATMPIDEALRRIGKE